MKIVVLAGGISTEREVSIVTGSMVYNSLIKNKANQVILMDVYTGLNTIASKDAFTDKYDYSKELDKIKENTNNIKNIIDNSTQFLGNGVIDICKQADIVFMALHGENGENGKVQAVFDLNGIKYTGSGYLGSAIAMDKGLTKKVLSDSCVPMAKGFSVAKVNYSKDEIIKKIGFPCVLKPCTGGSSIGVFIINNEKELDDNIDKAFSYEDEIVIEQFIKGRELSVAVVGGEALPIIEIIPKVGFYDYTNKYEVGMTNDVCPADIPLELSKKIMRTAENVGELLKLETYYRVDFLLQGDSFFCLEANTLPGMTPTSLMPQEALAVGISFDQLCEKLISLSLAKK